MLFFIFDGLVLIQLLSELQLPYTSLFFKGQHMLNNECGENYLIFRLILGGHTCGLQPYWIHSFPFALNFSRVKFWQLLGLLFSTWFQFFLGVASATPPQPSGLSHTSPASISCTEPVREKMEIKVNLFLKKNLGIAIEYVPNHHLIRPQFCSVSVERAFIVGFSQQRLDWEKNGPHL